MSPKRVGIFVMISSDYCRSVEGDLRNMFIIVGTSVIPEGGYLRGTEKMHINLYMKTRLKFGNA